MSEKQEWLYMFQFLVGCLICSFTVLHSQHERESPFLLWVSQPLSFFLAETEEA